MNRLIKMYMESKQRHSNKKHSNNKMAAIKEQKVNRSKMLITSYRSRDKKRFNEEIDLDVDWFIKNIFNSRCIYCGETNWKKLGCDRIDNSLPHNKDNVVPCCNTCNRMRSDDFSVSEFKKIGKILKEIYKQRNLKKAQSEKKERQCKPVGAFDEAGKKIKEYTSTKETIKDGYNPDSVRKVISRKTPLHGVFFKYL